MHVTRRSPHPVIINGEKQILTCHACGAQEARSVDESGEKIGYWPVLTPSGRF
jgi:hypothetical protein